MELFSTLAFPTLLISPIGLVPKTDGDFRLILHLSCPEHEPINYYNAQSGWSVHYSCIVNAAAMNSNLGQGTMLANSDIQSAFTDSSKWYHLTSTCLALNFKINSILIKLCRLVHQLVMQYIGKNLLLRCTG